MSGLELRETEGIEDSSSMNDDPSSHGCGLTSSTILVSCVQCLLLSAFLFGDRFDFYLIKLVKFCGVSICCLSGEELAPLIDDDSSSGTAGFSVVLNEL